MYKSALSAITYIQLFFASASLGQIINMISAYCTKWNDS